MGDVIFMRIPEKTSVFSQMGNEMFGMTVSDILEI